MVFYNYRTKKRLTRAKMGGFMGKQEQIVYKKLSELYLNENNPRLISDNLYFHKAEIK